MDTDNNKIKLEEEKKLLENELGGMGRVDKVTGEWEAIPEAQINPEADVNDLSDRAEGFEERTSTMVPLNARLDDINKALTAIEDGSYGICTPCLKEIEADRLEANPAALTCKECMNK